MSNVTSATGDPLGYTFPTGARRAELGKRYDLIPATLLRRLADRYDLGQEKYGEDNWKRGLPYHDIWNHIIDHLLHARDAQTIGHTSTEDHLAAAAWGIAALMYFEDEPSIPTIGERDETRVQRDTQEPAAQPHNPIRRPGDTQRHV
jgi:hypothetical protein